MLLLAMRSKTLLVFLLLGSFVCAHAQAPRAGAGGPPQLRFGGDVEKLFGANRAFTANMQMQAKMESGALSMPARISFLEGKARFEMDMTKIKGGDMPPGAAEQMKQMGMAEMVSISRPDKEETYLVYPGLKSYAVMPNPKPEAAAAASKDAELNKTALGKETVDGHPTTKYKVKLKDDQGKEQEATIWAASDLKDFPIKMEMTNGGIPTTITFQEVKFDKPDESIFNPPTGFQRYTDISTMMREAMMKRFAPGGFPPRE
jgi:outer membrane lipoprotein-sorting protein